MRNLKESFLIFSAERMDRGYYENEHATAEATDILKQNNVPYTEAVGTYEGMEETSFMIPWTTDNLQVVQELCRAFDQECYLDIDQLGQGRLYEPSGKFITDLGKAVRTETEPKGDYTRIGNTYLTFTSGDWHESTY